MRTPVQPSADRDIICDAVLLALAASKARTAWHAGVIDADTAMRRLDVFLSEIHAHRADVRSSLDSSGEHGTDPPRHWRRLVGPHEPA
jgi:hypothetical protein